MRDDRCPFFNGKHVLSKNKEEKIRKRKQDCSNKVLFVAFAQMVWKPLKLTIGRIIESGRQIGEEGRIFMVQEKLTTHFMIFVHWKTCSEHFLLR